ncbi:hypothetical protein Hypma_009254 [Hypsizygus marmoreus]|uniref:Uncharacterized protein n=1 Tax=Hypsizygus marmoreus TaxID=39966 RepID=A0A369JMY7_HYPMA|nr:hypothetical protein Hypma_009254 [Hypsizygus marmoreus]
MDCCPVFGDTGGEYDTFLTLHQIIHAGQGATPAASDISKGIHLGKLPKNNPILIGTMIAAVESVFGKLVDSTKLYLFIGLPPIFLTGSIDVPNNTLGCAKVPIPHCDET